MEPSARAGPRRVGGDPLGGESGPAIITAAADGIIAMDADGRIRLCNPAAEELFGRTADQLVGTRFGYPIAGASTEVILMPPGGGDGVVVEMRVTSTILEGERLHVASLRDVTHHNDMQRGLEHQQAIQHRSGEIPATGDRSPSRGIGEPDRPVGMLDDHRDRAVRLGTGDAPVAVFTADQADLRLKQLGRRRPRRERIDRGEGRGGLCSAGPPHACPNARSRSRGSADRDGSGPESAFSLSDRPAGGDSGLGAAEPAAERHQ